MKLNFISLETSLAKAMYYRNNPDMQFYSFKGVQLLPNDIYPYIQTTFNSEGVELEDWQVNVVSICGNVLADITDNFDVIDNFQDPDTGLPQITWSLRDLPDFGERLVYLEVNQLNGQTFYSTPFYLYADEENRTARIDYRDNEKDFMQSVQVNLHYVQKKPLKEYSQYYEITTENTRTNTIKSQYAEKWKTDIIDIEVLILIQSVFDFKYTYLNLTNASIFEPFEIPDLEADENFTEQEIMFSFVKSDVYDPNYVPPIPQPIPPVLNEIFLTDITPTNKYSTFNLFFTKNFDITFVARLYSVNGGDYVRNTGTANSPTPIPLPFGSYPFFTVFEIRLFQYVYSNKAFIKSGAGFWLLLTQKISETQYKIKIKYTPYIDAGATITWTNNGVSIVVPNSGTAETTINITEGQTLISSVAQIGSTEEITVTI